MTELLLRTVGRAVASLGSLSLVCKAVAVIASLTALPDGSKLAPIFGRKRANHEGQANHDRAGGGKTLEEQE